MSDRAKDPYKDRNHTAPKMIPNAAAGSGQAKAKPIIIAASSTSTPSGTTRPLRYPVIHEIARAPTARMPSKRSPPVAANTAGELTSREMTASSANSHRVLSSTASGCRNDLPLNAADDSPTKTFN